MATPDPLLETARAAIDAERDALTRVRDRLDGSFVALARAIADLPAANKVVTTGMGKSGLIATKIAATLASTGTLALFLHPAEGLHGDLGILKAGDILIALSKSGETREIIAILPSVKRIGARIAALVGATGSTLAREAEFILDGSVEREADPLNLAPTASTTAALALGDALAAVLIRLRGFTEERFALYHPGGSLGARLLLTCADLMIDLTGTPVVPRDCPMKHVLVEMTGKPTGGACVVDGQGRIAGIVTDGDLRRALHRGLPVLDLTAADLMTKAPKTIERTAKAREALDVMENRDRKVMVLPVVDEEGRPVGMLRLHDLIGAGI